MMIEILVHQQHFPDLLGLDLIFLISEFPVSTMHFDAAVLELVCTGPIIVILALLQVLDSGFLFNMSLQSAATVDVTSSVRTMEHQQRWDCCVWSFAVRLLA